MIHDHFDATPLFLLLDVVEHGSITAGSEKANLTTSAVSQRLTKL